MPLLALNGVPIPIELDEIETQVIEIGDRGRAEDGTELLDILGTKEEIPLRTRWLDADEVAAVQAALEVKTPQTATGDLVGAGYSATVQITGRAFTSAASGRLTRFLFTLREV